MLERSPCFLIGIDVERDQNIGLWRGAAVSRLGDVNSIGAVSWLSRVESVVATAAVGHGRASGSVSLEARKTHTHNAWHAEPQDQPVLIGCHDCAGPS